MDRWPCLLDTCVISHPLTLSLAAYSLLPQIQSSKAKRAWTQAAEAMSQNQPFFFMVFKVSDTIFHN